MKSQTSYKESLPKAREMEWAVFAFVKRRSLEKLKPTRLRRRLAGRRGRNLEASGEETTLVASWSSSFDSPALCLGGDGWSRNSMSQVVHLIFVAVFLSIHACTPSHIIQDQKRPRSENSLLEKGWIRNQQYDRIIGTEDALRLTTTFDNINHLSHPSV